MTSDAGYVERAPEYFRINGDNFTGRRLYDWIGHYDMLVTNACPELVTSAKGRGKPDVVWLHNNLADLQPYELLLVCGKVAQATYSQPTSWYQRGAERVVYCPHPAARAWTYEGLKFCKRLIRESRTDLHLRFKGNRLVATRLETVHARNCQQPGQPALEADS